MAGDILPAEDGRTERNSRAKRVVSEFISNNYVAINKQMTAIKLQPDGGGQGDRSRVVSSAAIDSRQQ